MCPPQIHSMADSLYKYRMGYVSENRKEKGLILGASHQDQHRRSRSGTASRNRLGAIKLDKERAVAREYMQALEVKATGPTSRSTA